MPAMTPVLVLRQSDKVTIAAIISLTARHFNLEGVDSRQKFSIEVVTTFEKTGQAARSRLL